MPGPSLPKPRRTPPGRRRGCARAKPTTTSIPRAIGSRIARAMSSFAGAGFSRDEGGGLMACHLPDTAGDVAHHATRADHTRDRSVVVGFAFPRSRTTFPIGCGATARVRPLASSPRKRTVSARSLRPRRAFLARRLANHRKRSSRSQVDPGGCLRRPRRARARRARASECR